LIKNKLPEGTFINLNVPYLPYSELKGFCITRQGIRVYHDALVKRKDPRGKPYFWIGGPAPTGVVEKDTDYGAIKSGYVSVTPLKLDLTAESAIRTLKDWKIKIRK
jgi:5'-nucleotidase